MGSGTPWLVIAGVGIGGAIGTWVRWAVSAWGNPLAPRLPLGTLTVNVVGGFLIGMALVWFMRHPELHPGWRLVVITGFLGGMTTFSAFSAESLQLLLRGEFGMAALHSALHLFGALGAAAAGYRLLHG